MPGERRSTRGGVYVTRTPVGGCHVRRWFTVGVLEEGHSLDVGKSHRHGEDEDYCGKNPLADRVPDFAFVKYHCQKTFHNSQSVFERG